MCLCFHPNLKFTKGIKVFKNAKQHHNEMLVSVKSLHVSLASFRFTAYLKNFLLIKQL